MNIAQWLEGIDRLWGGYPFIPFFYQTNALSHGRIGVSEIEITGVIENPDILGYFQRIWDNDRGR